MLGNGKTWRINIPVQQLREFEGGDHFCREVLSRPLIELSLSPEVGDQFEQHDPRPGSRAIVSSIGHLGSNDSRDRSHTAIGVGVINAYRYVAGAAKIKFKRLSPLTNYPAHWRVLPHPGPAGNLQEVSAKEYERLAALMK